MNVENKAGVYAISSPGYGYVYFGSSNRLRKRFTEHLVHLYNKEHHNRHLQKIANIVGPENLIFEVLLYTQDDTHKHYEGKFIQDFIEEPWCINIAPSPWYKPKRSKKQDMISQIKSGMRLDHDLIYGDHSRINTRLNRKIVEKEPQKKRLLEKYESLNDKPKKPRKDYTNLRKVYPKKKKRKILEVEKKKGEMDITITSNKGISRTFTSLIGFFMSCMKNYKKGDMRRLRKEFMDSLVDKKSKKAFIKKYLHNVIVDYVVKR